LMLSGVLVLCRLQVERINYHGPGLSTAIGAGIGASRRASQAGWNFRKAQGHRSPQAASILFNLFDKIHDSPAHLDIANSHERFCKC
jgi:hypothetical protein